MYKSKRNTRHEHKEEERHVSPPPHIHTHSPGTDVAMTYRQLKLIIAVANMELSSQLARADCDWQLAADLSLL